MDVGGQRHAQAALPPGKTPGTHVQKAGWTSGPVRTGAENFASAGVRTPDRNKSLPTTLPRPPGYDENGTVTLASKLKSGDLEHR